MKSLVFKKRPSSSTSSLSISSLNAAFCLVLLLLYVENESQAAKFCKSGRNQQIITKHCSGGSRGVQEIDYVCQKFTCNGGRSSFTLRTCADKKMGCMAGPAICEFSGGSGSCERCESDNCNH